MGNAALIARCLPHEKVALLENALGVTPVDGVRVGKTSSLPSSPSSPKTKGGNGSAIGCHNGVSAVAGVVISRLAAEDLKPLTAVQGLIIRAALECGGDAYFYSAPSGIGRSGIHGVDMPRTTRHRFAVVMTSAVGVMPGDIAPTEHAEVLRRALAMDGDNMKAAIQGQVAAACVNTALGLEGVLLMERPPSLDPIRGEGFEVLKGLRLWALALAERLERLHWQQRAREGREALVAAKAALETLVAGDLTATQKKASAVIPQLCIQDRVKSDRAALWFLDNETQELVLNNSGQLDGIRTPLAGALGIALRKKQVVHISDVEDGATVRYNRVLDERTGFKTKSVMCVPLRCAASSLSGSTANLNLGMEEVLAILQFKTLRGNRLADHVFGHFDLAGAEMLMDHSTLGRMIWLRHCFFKLLASERQIEQVQAVGRQFSDATGLADVVKIVEGELTEAMKCEACTIWFVDEERGEVWTPPTEKVVKGMRMKIGEGLLGKAVAAAQISGRGSGSVQVINDPRKSMLWSGDLDPRVITQNLITATVWAGAGPGRRRPVGVLQAKNKSRGTSGLGFGGPSFGESEIGFTENDAMLMELLTMCMGEHLQRLLLDISWMKTFMDQAGSMGSSEEMGEDDALDMVQEYYDAERNEIRSRQLSLLSGQSRQLTSRSRQPSILSSARFPSIEKQVPIQAVSSCPMSTTWLPYRLRPQQVVSHGWEDKAQPGSDIDAWRMDYWKMGADAEFQLLHEALLRFDALSELIVDQPTLRNFVDAIKQNYRNVPFHNMRHALATLHYAYKIAVGMNAQENLSRQDVFALFIAALCHDLDHRGRNNVFEITSRSSLALRYNDISPLENHHCALAFHLAHHQEARLDEESEQQGEGCNIFASFSGEQYAAVRRAIIEAILSTDMKNHGEMVDMVQRLSALEPLGGHPLLKLILHAADIGHSMMPQDMAAIWNQAIAQEYLAQVEEEEELGLPVTAFMQGLENPAIAARSQLSFIDFVVVPLMRPIFRIYPSLAEVKKCLELNKQILADEAEAARRPRTAE